MIEFTQEVEERFNRLQPCSHKEAFEQGVILGLEHGMSAMESAQAQILARAEEEPEEIEPNYDDGLCDNGSFIGV